jgi:hypothetical protein
MSIGVITMNNPFSAHEKTYIFEPKLPQSYRNDIRKFCDILANLPKGSTVWYEWTRYPETVAFAASSNESMRDIAATYCRYSVMRIVISGQKYGMNVSTITSVFGISMHELFTYLKSGWFQLETDGKILN